MKKDTTKAPRSKTAAPYPAHERAKFDREFTAQFRQDAAQASFNYHCRDKDTISPHPTVRLIKSALAGDTPHLLMLDLERSVHMMALCAGNLISLDAPLDVQYLAAHQRINDYHAGRTLCSPEEFARFGALLCANIAVRAVCAAVAAWQEEIAGNEPAHRKRGQA